MDQILQLGYRQFVDRICEFRHELFDERGIFFYVLVQVSLAVLRVQVNGSVIDGREFCDGDLVFVLLVVLV